MNKNILLPLLLVIMFNYSSSYPILQPDTNNVNLKNTTNTTCSLCKDVVNIIDGEIHIANSTINIMEYIIKEICSHLIILPASKKECFFILDNITEIVNWLLKGFSPKDICVKLGLCK